MKSKSARRILIVSYHFPPSRAVGALRWDGLTKYLGRKGHEIHILTAHGSEMWTHRPGITVQACPPLTTLNDLYRDRVVRRRQGEVAARTRTGPEKEEEGRPSHFSIWRLLKRSKEKAGVLLTWPDAGRGWVLKTALSVRSAIRDFAPDLILSSAPPHSSHLAVALAKPSGLPWVMDWRDPWFRGLKSHWYEKKGVGPLLATVERLLEQACVSRADGVIVTTSELQAEVVGRYPDQRVFYLRNGIDPESLPSRSSQPFPGLAVSHVGTILGFRDPTILLRAFRSFLDEHPRASNAGSKIRFVGGIEPPFNRCVEEFQRGPLKGSIETTGRVGRDEALDVLSRSSLAVVLAQSQKQMIPAKIYEAVAMGIPTLIIAECDSASYRLGMRLNLFCAEPEDEEAIRAAFRAVWGERVPPLNPHGLSVGYDELAERVHTILSSIA